MSVTVLGSSSDGSGDRYVSSEAGTLGCEVGRLSALFIMLVAELLDCLVEGLELSVVLLKQILQISQRGILVD